MSVRERRFWCAETLCTRQSSIETSAKMPARARLTGRLRTRLSQAVVGPTGAMSDVAAEHGRG
jgi:hypothetical protein